MTNKNKKNTLIDKAITVGQILVAILLIFLALGSFTISFFSISDLALVRGVVKSYYLAMIFPFIIDGTIVVSMLSYLIDSFRGHWSERPKWDGWFSVSTLSIIKHYTRTNLAVGMMISCASLSVWFNIEHSGSYTDISIAMGGCPPVALFFLSELLSDQARTTAKYSSVATTIDSLLLEQSELEGTNQELVHEISRLKEEVKQEALTLDNLQSLQSQYTISLSMCRELEDKVKGLREEAERLASENKAVKSESKQVTELTAIMKRQLVTWAARKSGVPVKSISAKTGVSDRQVGNDFNEAVTFMNGSTELLEELLKEKK